MNFREIVFLSFGFVIGTSLTALFLVDKYEKLLQQEIEFSEGLVENWKEKKEIEQKKMIKEVTTECKTADENIKYVEHVEEMVEMYNGGNPIERFNKIAPSDDEPRGEKPYVISFEEFCESDLGHEQVTLTYYFGDNTLADENEDIMDNVIETVGGEALKLLENTDSVYVRNERLSIDYDILGDHRSYKEAVLGEGCEDSEED